MNAENLPVLALADANFVTPQLLVGADLETFDRGLAADQLAELVGAGVTHILDARMEWTDEELVRELQPSISYFHHGVDDAGQELSGTWFEECVSWIREANASGGVVLVHCHMGINRAPSLAFAALLDQERDVANALETVRASRAAAVIDYADDVLRWHHERTAAAPERVATDRSELADWRQRHHVDVQEVIRAKRTADLDFAGERYPRLRLLRRYLESLGGTRLDVGEDGSIYFRLNGLDGQARIDVDGKRIVGSLDLGPVDDPAAATAWVAQQPPPTSAVLECVGTPDVGYGVRLRFERIVHVHLGLDDTLTTESEAIARAWTARGTEST